MKISRKEGYGQSSCKRCEDKGKWNRSWVCELYSIEGFEGSYCYTCVNEILLEENQQLKEQLKDENNYHNEAVKWYKEAFDIEQERIKYKSVLDEIREMVSHFSGGQICECSKELGMQIEKILDKVKEHD